MSVLAEDSSLSLSSRVSRPVDGALVGLRWLLIALAGLAVTLVSKQIIPENFFLVWIITYASFNGIIAVGLRYRQIPQHLPLIALAGDVLFLSVLPFLPDVNNPYLILFTIFPTLVGAMRFGVSAGAIVAVISLLPYEVAGLYALLPARVQALVPITFNTDIDLFSAVLPVIALLGAIVLVGYLTEREREAAVGAAQVELDELRQAFASARLFYESTDLLNSSSNYVQILEVMLQAGVSGMPKGGVGAGAPVGVAFVFDDKVRVNGEKALSIMASRALDRADADHVITGTQGIIAKVLENGDPVPFTRLTNDPELSQFSSLRRAHTGICFPLQSGLDVYGIVVLATQSSQMPTEQHLRLIRAFINQAAVAIQNAQLYQNLRGERDRIIEAESAARAKLARDLHDGPTQSMAALAMRLDFVRLLLDRDPGQAKQELEQAREAVMRVGKELRGLLFTLRPLTLETQGLSAALRQYEQRLRENDAIPISIQPGSFGNELDPNIAGTVFAVIEEAVNNARKHAPGAPIHVGVQKQGDSLVASIRDEGPGFDMNSVSNDYSARGSLGMVNMQDRARLIEGQLSVESAPGRGTQLILRVPLDPRRAKARANGGSRPESP